MKGVLTEEETARLDEIIRKTEERTKAEIVLAVVERSDSYAELPWKAFALGASSTGFVIFVLGLFMPYEASHRAVLAAIAGMLAFGGVCALLSIFIPGFARLFLAGFRSEVEVRQYAESLFLQRELFATAERTGVLLFVSLFEGRSVLLADRGLAGRLSEEATRSVIGPMTTCLGRGETGRALHEGLERLRGVLEGAAPGIGGENELPDAVIEEEGA